MVSQLFKTNTVNDELDCKNLRTYIGVTFLIFKVLLLSIIALM